MASAFPTLTQKPDKTSFVEETYKPQIKAKFEDGYVQSRARATRSRKRWSMQWSALVNADYQLIVSHFDASIGDTFDWIHPVYGTTYTVRYSNDSLKAQLTKGDNRWSVSLELEEA